MNIKDFANVEREIDRMTQEVKKENSNKNTIFFLRRFKNVMQLIANPSDKEKKSKEFRNLKKKVGLLEKEYEDALKEFEAELQKDEVLDAAVEEPAAGAPVPVVEVAAREAPEQEVDFNKRKELRGEARRRFWMKTESSRVTAKDKKERMGPRKIRGDGAKSRKAHGEMQNVKTDPSAVVSRLKEFGSEKNFMNEEDRL